MSEPLAAWTPALPVFIRRTVIVGAITLTCLAAVGWIIGVLYNRWEVFYLAPFLALVYNIGMEDPTRWRAARQSRWHLRTDAIIYHGPDGETRIPLVEITDVRTRFGWSVVLFLEDGQRVRMTYLPECKYVAMQIRSARARLLP
jgi:hypothetical protein